MKCTKINMKAKQALISALMISAIANAYAGLPNPGMAFDPKRTAVVITDPQNMCRNGFATRR